MQLERQQLQNTKIITAEDKIHSKTVLTKHLENLTLSPQPHACYINTQLHCKKSIFSIVTTHMWYATSSLLQITVR